MRTRESTLTVKRTNVLTACFYVNFNYYKIIKCTEKSILLHNKIYVHKYILIKCGNIKLMLVLFLNQSIQLEKFYFIQLTYMDNGKIFVRIYDISYNTFQKNYLLHRTLLQYNKKN